MNCLLEAGDGLVRLVTLAPERDRGMDVTRFLAGKGILVSAGHCNPNLEQLDAAIEAGLSMFTHLGNGCPMLLARHDNIIQRALSRSDRLTVMFIGDNVHVSYIALGNYLRIVGADCAIGVTDCIAAAGLPPGRYTLGSQAVEVESDGAAWAPDRSHLCGSTISMPRMTAKLVAELGLDQQDVQRMTVHNPRRVLKLSST